MRMVSRLAALILLYAASAIPARAGEVVTIKISDLAVMPADVTVNVGDTIEWVNEDFVDHTATASAGSWDVAVAAGQRARLRVTEAQTTDYICRFHPNMTGRITARVR